jgi:hypothetical protein
MRTTLHLLTHAPGAALAAIDRQHREPDTRVTVVLLHGGAAPSLPRGVAVRHVPRDLGYGELLELIFESDQVVSW